jgi:phosphoglycolate phosphatase
MFIKYQLVMFDFDGTLADSFPWLVNVTRKISDKYQLKALDSNTIEALHNSDSRQLTAQFNVPFWKVPQIVNYARQLASHDVDQIPLFAGVNDMLANLTRKGITLAVVSSNAIENVQHVLGPENTTLISFFECGASLSGKEARVKRVLKQSGIPASRAILIGDEVRDLEAARKAGVASGAVSWGYNYPDLLAAHSPTELFTSLDDLTIKLTG